MPVSPKFAAWLWITLVVLSLLGVCLDHLPQPVWAVPSPPMQGNDPAAIRALGLSFEDMASSPATLDTLEKRVHAVGINLVGLNAGRLDWNYFKWAGHEAQWSADVRDNNRDFLAENVARFGKDAHITAMIDVFAPRYIEQHPKVVALTPNGTPVPLQVSTMALVEGDFGKQLLAMIDYIAAHYPVDSISLTELGYYKEGYGPDDKAAYLAYTGRTDWPRTWLGGIKVDDPSIGAWRSYEVSRFVARAADAVHRRHKQLFVDVRISWGNLQNESRENGQDYALLLAHADRLILWDYFGQNYYYGVNYTADIAQYMQKYRPDQFILSFGLWAKFDQTLPAASLGEAIQIARNNNAQNIWITPSHLMNEEHWRALQSAWEK